MFRVHLGYTATGRSRWRRFNTLDAAVAFANDYFNRKGIVVSIIAGG